MLRIARTVEGRWLIGDADGYVPASSVDPELADRRTLLARATTSSIDPGDATAPRLPADRFALGSPVANPPQLWGVGLNYRNHAADLDESRPDAPATFLQPPGVLRGPGGPIELPPRAVSDTPTAEAELGVVIGRDCREVAVEEADAVIAGYVVAIDVTAEDIIRERPRYLTRSKQFDSFLVLGSSIAIPAERTDPPLASWEIRTMVAGSEVATAPVGDARFSPAEVVAAISTSTTLQAGSVIITGTPGAGKIGPGDAVRAEIDPIGDVTATVVR